MSNKTSITTNSKVEDFLLVCPSASGIAEAIHALYYLPQNYRLVVLSQAAQDSDDDTAWAASDMMERVQFETKTGLSNGTSPFSSADAVISDDAMSNVADSTPMVVLSRYADEGIETTGANRFEVATDNPEALASAILNIAKSAKSALRTPSEIQQYA
jgi:hypothetical protein